MTTITALPTRNYAAGAHAFGPVAIPDTVSSIGISILRCTSADTTIWPNQSDTISFDIQVSFNGGPFQEWASGTGNGGIDKDKLGNEIPTMYIQGDVPAGTNRSMQGTVTLSASIKTGASVTVL